MIKNMQAGIIIYDLAAIQGGNTPHLLEVDKIMDKDGVKIMGETNILNKLTNFCFNILYAKNVI